MHFTKIDITPERLKILIFRLFDLISPKTSSIHFFEKKISLGKKYDISKMKIFGDI